MAGSKFRRLGFSQWSKLGIRPGFAGPVPTLHYGMNLLAAEVHQTGVNGSDMVFGARLKINSAPLASDQWRLLNFGSAANSGVGADLADPDGDGITNLMEYALVKD